MGASQEPPAPDYPMWKKLAWRFIRVGLSGGLSAAGTIQVLLKPDWSNSKAVILTVTSALVTGFISSAGMAIREWLSQGDRDALIQKLPL